MKTKPVSTDETINVSLTRWRGWFDGFIGLGPFTSASFINGGHAEVVGATFRQAKYDVVSALDRCAHHPEKTTDF